MGAKNIIIAVIAHGPAVTLALEMIMCLDASTVSEELHVAP